jgi:hypothetical protein
MPSESAVHRYRRWYARLLRLYPAHHRARFAEAMEQTFNDLCRERTREGKPLTGLVVWTFVDTGTGIVREHLTPLEGTVNYPVSRAILVGHLVVTGPVFVIVFAGFFAASSVNVAGDIGVFVGAAVAWLYWSLAIPRWRAWALGKGADPRQLQRVGVATGLLWPKGWIFGKTELPPR